MLLILDTWYHSHFGRLWNYNVLHQGFDILILCYYFSYCTETHFWSFSEKCIMNYFVSWTWNQELWQIHIKGFRESQIPFNTLQRLKTTLHVIVHCHDDVLSQTRCPQNLKKLCLLPKECVPSQNSFKNYVFSGGQIISPHVPLISNVAPISFTHLLL